MVGISASRSGTIGPPMVTKSCERAIIAASMMAPIPSINGIVKRNPRRFFVHARKSRDRAIAPKYTARFKQGIRASAGSTRATAAFYDMATRYA